ncbi:uncharacterized protein [Henckelia pumila]|uniref:uncharacterized protein n=1 Tax=Henckelia pumila TaxID=405737 RepID=UPI003C6DC166
MIADNILLAHELTHSLNLPARGGNVILKLDMAKAYDRVQWSFLLDALRRFGFSEQVVRMVRACISFCKFSFNVNGTPAGFFSSSRGLRQGDPLSPLLFVLGAEYLSRGLDRLFLQHSDMRYQSGCDLTISHLAYADDVIIFANGGSRGLQRLKDFLSHYENCSGQLVNVAKSTMIFPPGWTARRRSRLLRITGFEEGQLPLKYLGAPFFHGNHKCSLFEPLLQSVRKKLEGWESRSLAPGKKKWHWARWSRACLPVKEGGLGFRRLKDIVDSFSMKLWFRFWQGSSLWARFLLRKYCRTVSPICAPSRGAISPTWRRLLQIRPRVERGIRWRIGLGDVSFWDDTWLGDAPLTSRCDVRGDQCVRVSSFLLEGDWDFDLLCAVVAPSVAEEIVQIPVLVDEPDAAIWIHSTDGAFSVRSSWEQAARMMDISVGLQRTHKTAIVRWLRPQPESFKLNVDGSSRGNPGESSVGGVVRDSSGRVLAFFSEFIGLGSNVRAELWAVWRGILLCSDLSFFPLWIETDSQISIQILRSRRFLWDLDHIVSRTRVLVRNRPVHFSHIYREGNSVADALARHAHDHRQCLLEIGVPLTTPIAALARSDLSGLPYLRFRYSSPASFPEFFGVSLFPCRSLCFFREMDLPGIHYGSPLPGSCCWMVVMWAAFRALCFLDFQSSWDFGYGLSSLRHSPDIFAPGLLVCGRSSFFQAASDV